MSRKGQNLTHWTMHEVRLRCVEDDDTGCLIWRGTLNSQGYPCASVNGKTVLIRRLVYFDLMGRRRTEGLRVTTKCRSKVCLSEHCLVGKTFSEILKRSFADRVERDPLYLRRYQLIPKKTGRGRLERAQADAIRASDRPTEALAEEYGVSTEAICAIRSGRTWKPMRLPVNSIFNLGD